MNEKSKVGTAATLAAAAALVALACTCSTCGLSDFSLPSLGGGGGSDADAEAFYDALLEHEYEDPFDPELLVMADDDGDGLPEATYPLTVEEEVAPGVYLDRWLYLDPQGEAVEDIEGTLQLVLENTTDDPVDVTFVDEIPKDVLERIEPGDIQVEPPVEITILDEDPRYEVRVFQFAAGMRQTIAKTKVSLKDSMLYFTDREAFTTLEKSEQLGGVIEMTARATARDYEFLRQAKRCMEYSQPGVRWDDLTDQQREEAWACNMRLVAEFRENFTVDVCSEAGLYRMHPNQTSGAGIPAGWQQSCEQFFAQSCTEHENDGVRAMCLEAMRRESYIECTLWPAAEQEHCRLVADRSHTENCSMMIADRASRRVCCDKMTGDLKDLCLEDNTAVQVAEEEGGEAADGDAAGDADGDGEDEASAGTTGPGSPGGPGEGETVYDVRNWFPPSEAEALCSRFAYIVPDYTMSRAEGGYVSGEEAVESGWVSEYSLPFGRLNCEFTGPDYFGQGYPSTMGVVLAAFDTERAAQAAMDPDSSYECVNPEPQAVPPCFEVSMGWPPQAFDGSAEEDHEWFDVAIGNGGGLVDNVFFLISHYGSPSEEEAWDAFATALGEVLALIEERQTLTLGEVLGTE